MKEKLLFLVSLFFTVSIIAQVDPDLLLEYRFENNFNDDSGNEFHATNFGTTFVDDRFGNPNAAIYFDGIDDFVELPNIVDLKPELPLSISFWIKFDDISTSNSDVFNTSHEENTSSGVFFNLAASTGQYGVGHGDGTLNYTPGTRRSFLSDAQAQENVWTHITLVINSSTDMKIYVNCQDMGGSHSGSGGSLFYSATPGNLGRHDRNMSGPANYFKGAIDDFRYWKRALDPSEVVSETCDGTLGLTSSEEVLLISPKLYPNPSNGILHIQEGSKEILKIHMYDVRGRKVLSTTQKSNIDISDLPKGIYLVRLVHEDGFTNEKVILEK